VNMTTARSLNEYPPALDVDPACEEAVRAAKRRAAEVGLVLPPDFVTLWVKAPGAPNHAETHVSNSRYVCVFMRDDLGPRGTYETMLHELQHVADASIIPHSSRDEVERRAEAFVVRAMRGDPVNTIDARRSALRREGQLSPIVPSANAGIHSRRAPPGH